MVCSLEASRIQLVPSLNVLFEVAVDLSSFHYVCSTCAVVEALMYLSPFDWTANHLPFALETKEFLWALESTLNLISMNTTALKEPTKDLIIA